MDIGKTITKILAVAIVGALSVTPKPAQAFQGFISFDEESCRAIIAMEQAPAGVAGDLTTGGILFQGLVLAGSTIVYLDHIKDTANARCVETAKEKESDRLIEDLFRYCVKNIGTEREKDLLIESASKQVWPYNRFTWTKPVRRNYAADGVLRKAANMNFVGGTSHPSRVIQNRREILSLYQNCKIINDPFLEGLLEVFIDIADYVEAN